MFDLWAVPGRKALSCDGQDLWLHGVSGRALVGLKLAPGVAHGAPFAYALPAGAAPRDARYTLETALALLQAEPRASTPTALARPARSALVHVRTLQALDGLAAGASQRTIAGVLFGPERVAVGWEPDGELRAQVRYLLQRGRKLREGEYRELLR